jgi:hypothetical protein
MQHYVAKFVSDLRQVGGFLRVLQFPPPIKLVAWNIVESGIKYHNRYKYNIGSQNYSSPKVDKDREGIFFLDEPLHDRQR